MTGPETRYVLEIEAPYNSRIRKSTLTVRDMDGRTCASDTADLSSARERRRVSRDLARQLGEEPLKWLEIIEAKSAELLDEHQRLREQQEFGSPEALADTPRPSCRLAPGSSIWRWPPGSSLATHPTDKGISP